MNAPAPRCTVVSFGYLHGPAPEADLTFDVRRYLRDPAGMQGGGLLDSDGHDPQVQRIVLDTPGAVATLHVALAFVAGFPQGKGTPTVAFGCAGGRHRSAALAVMLANDLEAQGYEVEIEHRDIHRPRVLKA